MRITTSIVMFYFWLTAAANLLMETGVAQSMGVSTSLSAGEKLVAAEESLRSIEASGIAVESLVGVFVAVAKVMEALAAGLTAGPRLLLNLGIPSPLVVFLFAPMPLLAGRLIIYALSGRDI